MSGQERGEWVRTVANGSGQWRMGQDRGQWVRIVVNESRQR